MSELEIYKGMVKKILDEFMNFDFNSQWERMEINEYERNQLKDYITNLQQENERLKVKYNKEKSHQINYNYFETLYSKSTKEIVIDDLVWKCEELDNFKKEYEKSYIEKEDYKSRIEKAVEYKHNWQNVEENETIVFDNNKLIDFFNKMEKILNGRSDENE